MPASEVAGALQARPHATKFHYPPVSNSKDSDDKVLPVPRFWQKKQALLSTLIHMNKIVK
ncbi:hypothetical protein [Desulfovibrio sp. QI0442]